MPEAPAEPQIDRKALDAITRKVLQAPSKKQDKGTANTSAKSSI